MGCSTCISQVVENCCCRGRVCGKGGKREMEGEGSSFYRVGRTPGALVRVGRKNRSQLHSRGRRPYAAAATIRRLHPALTARSLRRALCHTFWHHLPHIKIASLPTSGRRISCLSRGEPCRSHILLLLANFFMGSRRIRMHMLWRLQLQPPPTAT